MNFLFSGGVRCLIGMRVGGWCKCPRCSLFRYVRNFGRILVTSVLALAVLLAAETAMAREFSSYASVEDDGSLRVGTRKVHLYGIYIPPTGQHCRTFFSPPVCGSRATLALQFKIQGFVHCREKSSNRDRSINAICYVNRTNHSEGEDLGAYLVQQGWAMARPEAPFEYQALEKIARQQSAGIWGFTVDGIQRKPLR